MLAAIVADYDADYQVWQKHHDLLEQLKKLKRKVPALSNRITRRKMTVTRNLNELLKNSARTVYFYNPEIRRAAIKLASVIDRVEDPSPTKVQAIQASFKSHPGPGNSNPDSPVTYVLYNFFLHDCSLRPSKAEVLTAKVGNAIWGWNIKVDETPESLGSPAVRLRVTRFKKQLTARK